MDKLIEVAKTTVKETTTKTLAERGIFDSATAGIGSGINQATQEAGSAASQVTQEVGNIINQVTTYVENKVKYVENIGITILLAFVFGFLFICIPQTSLVLKWWLEFFKNLFTLKWFRKENNVSNNRGRTMEREVENLELTVPSRAQVRRDRDTSSNSREPLN